MYRITAFLKIQLLLLFWVLTGTLFSQQPVSTNNTHFSGTAQLTNNGISLVPNFSLGKPAVIVNLSAGNNRFSFDPDIRFSMTAKPWTMLFWGRYKPVNSGRFRLTTGAHLGLNFKPTLQLINGEYVENNIARRYLAAEIAPNYFITKNITAGVYYLYSHGLDAGTVKNTHFLVLNSAISNIKLAGPVYAKLLPQVYYLKQDAHEGTYFTITLNVERKNFPFSVTGLMNRKMGGDIAATSNTLWSAGLVYSFSK